MTRRIYKYEVPLSDDGPVTITTHAYPCFLSCAFQGNILVVWAEVTVSDKRMPVQIAVVPTGGEVLTRSMGGMLIGDFNYIGTAIHQVTGIVLHVYTSADVKY